MEKDNRYLQLQGIVSEDVLSKIVPVRKFTKANTKWLFVDYAPKDYKVGTRFDVMLKGENKLMVPEIFNIKLLNVLDQFGNHLDSIPMGSKTICRFEFIPTIPKEIKDLPIIKYWKYNKMPIIIARHDEIIVDESNAISDDVYVEIINGVLSVFTTPGLIKKADIDLLLSKIADNNQEVRNKLLSKLDITSDMNKGNLEKAR